MDLLLVSLDSLRLDHAGRAADSQVRTPRFDAATAGFAFSERCFSVASATRPVHTSLVTGLYPFEHGIEAQHDQRLRAGAPRLFAQLREQGRAVGLFSEAATIFTGLDLGAPVQALDPRPVAGVEAARRWLRSTAGRDRCLFLHYWSAHTPYGAADGKALGQTAQLLRAGRADVVRQRYRRAVEDVFEAKVAPLLEDLDLGRWAVILFGDHGESWTDDEPYHGVTVRNSVLRVPLYLHVPFRQPRGAWGDAVLSLLDLYPTLCGLLDLPRRDRGFGVDWLAADGGDLLPGRYLWAGIRPGGTDDDPAAPGAPAVRPPLRWSVFDATHKLLGETNEAADEDDGSSHLVDTWGEAASADTAALAALRAARRDLLAASTWTAAGLEAHADADEALLRRRLRDLGYLG